MNNLSLNTLLSLPQSVQIPPYDIENTGSGIVHLGPGAFHRGHQAVYTDLAMKYGGNWRITAVSMRSSVLKEKLMSQDNLYSLMVLDNEPYIKVVGALKSILVLDEDRDEVMQALVSPDTYIATITVTEKGYCLNPDGTLNLEHKDIVHDLSNFNSPISVIGLLVKALLIRFQEKQNLFTVISCDNLPNNGDKLKAAVLKFAEQISDQLVDWISHSIQFPNTMVDSITPATDESVIEQCQQQLGVKDAWPVQREGFSQWVIENKFSGPCPAWDRVGVTITNNVEAFEKAKLRILNGTHSTLAYLGGLVGIETVYEAISRPSIEAFIRKLLEEEIIPSIGKAPEVDLTYYAYLIINRFHNKHIRHLLSQIACDGSQKIPVRILNPIRENIQANRPNRLLCTTVATWILYLYQSFKNDIHVIDPMEDTLKSIYQRSSSPKTFAQLLVGETEIFVGLFHQSQFVKPLFEQLDKLGQIDDKWVTQCLVEL